MAAQPTWKRFVQAPLARNCRLPAHWLSTVPSAPATLPGVEAEHPGGGRGRTERAAGRGGMEAAVVMLAGRQGERDAAGDLVAGDDGGEDVGAARRPPSRRRRGPPG